MKRQCTRCDKCVEIKDVFLRLLDYMCVCRGCYPGLRKEINERTKEHHGEE